MYLFSDFVEFDHFYSLNEPGYNAEFWEPDLVVVNSALPQLVGEQQQYCRSGWVAGLKRSWTRTTVSASLAK